MENHSKILDCKVLVVGKNTHLQTIVAFYITAENEDGIEEQQIEMENKLRKIFPPYMLPKLFSCSSFPTLVNGKVDRQALIKSYEDGLVFEASYTDEELKQDGCTDSQFYDEARKILNAICSVLGKYLVDMVKVHIYKHKIEINTCETINVVSI